MEGNLCGADGCQQEARMQCPTCLKLSLAPSYFCSQDCFRKAWAVHKLVHNQPKRAETTAAAWDPDEHLRKFEGFQFTGTLRPAQLTAPRAVPAHIKRPDYAENGVPLSEMAARGNAQIEAKSPAQIAKMRATCRLGREVLDAAARMVRPGTTTDEIDRMVHDMCIERGAYPSPLNYSHFPRSICTSVNEVICHGIPDLRELQDGDIVNIDISTFLEGYHADLNETYFCGAVDDASRVLVQSTYECLMMAIHACKPGVMYRELGNIIQKHATARGLSVVRSYVGHGLGRLFHTTPNIPHYAKNKAVGVMRPGHTFTIEPMINQGTYRDLLWPDQWTSVTADGKRSAQFEHTVLITDTGYEILTARLPTSPPMQFEPVLPAGMEIA